MNRVKTLLGSTAALTAALSTLAFAAGAQPVAHSSGCTRGKEARGCKLDGTGYYSAKSNAIVGFVAANAPKGSHNQLAVPGVFVCAKANGVTMTVNSNQVARIGGSLSFSGKVTVAGSPGIVKSAQINAKLSITNAKRAHLSGKVKLTLSAGSTCSKSLSGKLTRVLGG
jgi:hypothetical protein